MEENIVIDGKDYTVLNYTTSAYSVATKAAALAVKVNGSFSER